MKAAGVQPGVSARATIGTGVGTAARTEVQAADGRAGTVETGDPQQTALQQAARTRPGGAMHDPPGVDRAQVQWLPQKHFAVHGVKVVEEPIIGSDGRLDNLTTYEFDHAPHGHPSQHYFVLVGNRPQEGTWRAEAHTTERGDMGPAIKGQVVQGSEPVAMFPTAGDEWLTINLATHQVGSRGQG